MAQRGYDTCLGPHSSGESETGQRQGPSPLTQQCPYGTCSTAPCPPGALRQQNGPSPGGSIIFFLPWPAPFITARQASDAGPRAGEAETNQWDVKGSSNILGKLSINQK